MDSRFLQTGLCVNFFKRRRQKSLRINLSGHQFLGASRSDEVYIRNTHKSENRAQIRGDKVEAFAASSERTADTFWIREQVRAGTFESRTCGTQPLFDSLKFAFLGPHTGIKIGATLYPVHGFTIGIQVKNMIVGLTNVFNSVDFVLADCSHAIF